MGKYWTDKTDGVDTILAENFNDAFTGIESDIAQKADKASTDSALEQKADKSSVDADISEVNVALERIKYYGSADVVPSDESWFTVNDTGETITGLTDYCRELDPKDIVIPYKIAEVTITGIGNDAFSAIGAKTIRLPNSITNIGAWAFSSCDGLITVNIPDGVTIIEYGLFAGCSILGSINIPDGVTSIGGLAFIETALSNVEIPESVTVIGERAFESCPISSIVIPKSVTSISNDTFDSCTSFTIYCEQGSYADEYAKENNISVVYTDVKSEAFTDKMTYIGARGIISAAIEATIANLDTLEIGDMYALDRDLSSMTITYSMSDLHALGLHPRYDSSKNQIKISDGNSSEAILLKNNPDYTVTYTAKYVKDGETSKTILDITDISYGYNILGNSAIVLQLSDSATLTSTEASSLDLTISMTYNNFRQGEHLIWNGLFWQKASIGNVRTTEVLTKTNTTEFTPTADYQPATKKYVDDAISAAISAYDTEVMALLGGDAE